MACYYTTNGSVRGNCGHKHRTLSGAVACLERDQSGCRSQGGYSDRSIYEVDGGEEFALIRLGSGRLDYVREGEDDDFLD